MKGTRMRPEARTDQLLTQEVGTELVVYDERTHQAHRLNGTARTVWHLADGRRSVDDLASALQATLGTPEAGTLVRLALADLNRAGLLVTRPGPDLHETPSRRQMLTAAASAFVPVVASIVAPPPAAAQSGIMSPSPMPPTRSSFNGTYVGTGTQRPQEGCGSDILRPMVDLIGTLSLDVSASVEWSKTHQPDTVFDFATVNATVQSNNGLLLTATGMFSPDNFYNYTVIENYTITGDSLAGTQTFSLSVCTWIYDITMTRQPS